MARAYPTDGQLNFLHYVEFHHWNSLDDSTRKTLKAVISGSGYAIMSQGNKGMRQTVLNKLRDKYLDIYILSRK